VLRDVNHLFAPRGRSCDSCRFGEGDEEVEASWLPQAFIIPFSAAATRPLQCWAKHSAAARSRVTAALVAVLRDVGQRSHA
jgi:hypothetical protein